MRLAETFTPARIMNELPAAGLYIMLGLAMGYMFFLTAFPYYCAPFDSGMKSWHLALALIGIGSLSGYLYPDIAHVLASAVLLPLLGALFFFIIFMSPTFLQDIIITGIDDIILEGTRSILAHLALAFLAIFVSGFISMYLFEAE